MKQKIIIVDNFYDNPFEVYKAAKEAEYEDSCDTNYPGRNSVQNYFNEEAHYKIMQLLGREVYSSPDSTNGIFRMGKEGEEGKLNVHCDIFDDWAGVLYLNLPVHAQGRKGTSFYIHKQTGLDHTPTKEEMKLHGWTNLWEIKEGFSTIDSKNPNAWEEYMYAPMRYNRLVLFDTKLWHSSGPGFGDSINNCRLVQLFFLAERK